MSILRKVDYTGSEFGDLTCVGPSARRRYWVFQCKCGNRLERVPSNLKINKYNACRECLSGSGTWSWSGYGEIPQDVFNTIHNGAKAKGLEFNVTIEYLWELFLKQNRRCVFTGEELFFNKTYRTKTLKTASLDRIDSSTGYIPGNVQWVHRDVNKLKKNFSDARFVEICKRVAKFYDHD